MRGAVRAVAAAAALAVASGALAVGTPGVAGSAESRPNAYAAFATESEACELFAIDGSGAATDLPASASVDACVRDLAVDPSGTVWGIEPLYSQGGNNAALVRFSANGTPTTIPLTTGVAGEVVVPDYGGLAVTAAGEVLAVLAKQLVVVPPAAAEPAAPANPCLDHNCLYSIDPATGLVTPIGRLSTELVDAYWNLAACGSTLWSLDIYEGNNFVTVDPSTGAAGPRQADPGDRTVGFDCVSTQSAMWALFDTQGPGSTDPYAVGRIDPATAARSEELPVTGLPDRAPALAFAVVPTAAPTTPTTPTTAPTTSTTTPKAAEAAQAVPTFTG